MQFRAVTYVCAVLLLLVMGGCPPLTAIDPDEQLRSLIAAAGVTPLEKPATDPAKVRLGEALFFDKELSGNRNISCATCHHPAAFTTDALSVSKGQGGVGLGPSRLPPLDGEGAPVFIPRNAPDLFNRGAIDVMFWDGRLTRETDGSLLSPAGEALPAVVSTAVAAQAMFPVTSRDEMRGMPGENEIADVADDDFVGMWTRLMQRLLAFDEYRELFAAAFRGVPEAELNFGHAAVALAEFEIGRWTLDDAPFDDYLRGDDSALSAAAQRGAALFFGAADCARCHSGTLLTDQRFHNRCTPQVGPGKGDGEGGVWDFGRGRETGRAQDMFAFRTPSLRNVAATGPWMHAGAFTTLEAAVRHCADPVRSARTYDPTQLAGDMQALYRADQTPAIIAAVDPADLQAVALSDGEVADLVAFLESLSSPTLNVLGLRDVPERVPSGLPLAD